MGNMRHFWLVGTVAALVWCGCGKGEKTAEAPAAAPVGAETPAADAPSAAAATGGAAAPARVVYATEESLAAYNKELRAWIERTSVLPQNVKELNTLRSCPRPPPAPLGRTLVFDPKTWSVHLE